MKQVLLAIPPTDWRRAYPKLSVLYLAATLEKAGFQPLVLDGQIADLTPWAIWQSPVTSVHPRSLYKKTNWNWYRVALQRVKPAALVISASTPEIENGARLAALAKELYPEVLTIATNHHVSALPRETLQEFPEIDIVFKGEPELALPQFLQEVFSSSGHWSRFPGIAYRDGEKIVENQGFHSIASPNSLPYPSRHLLPLFKYQLFFKKTRFFGSAHPFGMLRTSRGCPSQCTFCTVPAYKGTAFRAQTPEYVLAEMEYLIQRYRVRRFHFWDDIFTVDPHRVRAIAKGILARGWTIAYECMSKANFIDPATLQALRRSGCQTIFYGAESGSDAILSAIQKGFTTKELLEAVAMTKKAGIEPAVGFILGHFEETEETLEETLHFAQRLAEEGVGHIQFWRAIPFPGTPLFDKVRSRLLTKKWSHFTPFIYPDQSPQELFAHPHLTFSELLKYQKAGQAFWEKKKREPQKLLPAHTSSPSPEKKLTLSL